jgi:adenosylcobinamide-phosphate synthase
MDRDRAKSSVKSLGIKVNFLSILAAIVQSPPGILVSAAVLDFLLGDPWSWPHPVRVIGCAINLYCKWIWRWLKRPFALRVAGIVLALGLVLGSAVLVWAGIRGAYLLWKPLGWVVEVTLLASCFAGRSLRDAAEDVLAPLQEGNTELSRTKLSQYVGRDTEDLTKSEILRAVLETVAENTTDGVMAPLFYAILGLALPTIGPAPFAIAYKATSTLDSMVGYRDEPYAHIGWFSAHLDDVLTWLPCRLNVMTLGMISGKLPKVWKFCQHDAVKDPSPNSGWSECAYAAILDVQLGGLNTYRGVLKLKPFLGKPQRTITPELIRYALRLMRNSFILWVAIALAIWIIGTEL